MSIKESNYEVIKERDDDIILYNKADGRSYVCPLYKADNGQKYTIVKEKIYYL